MDTLLQTVITIFMLFLCLLCLFAVLVIARDIVVESARRRKGKTEDEAEPTPAPIPAPAPAPVVIVKEVPTPTPVVEEVKEEKAEEPAPVVQETPVPDVDVAVVAVAEEEEDENAVTFSTTHNLSIEEKYATLSSEYKSYFDSIVKHALGKEGIKENKNRSYYDYKIGSARVLRLSIKRGEVICEYQFIDTDFKSYADASNVKLTRSATKIRVVEPSAVGVAKDGIDIICQQIAEERERKKALAREKRNERRREQRQKEKEESAAAEASQTAEAETPEVETANV